MIDVYVGTRRSFEHYCWEHFQLSADQAVRTGCAIHFQGWRDTAMRDGKARLVVGYLASLDLVDAATSEVHLMNLRSSA